MTITSYLVLDYYETMDTRLGWDKLRRTSINISSTVVRLEKEYYMYIAHGSLPSRNTLQQ